MIYPAKVDLTFATLPAGLSISMDGISYTTPLTYDTLIGFSHQVAATNQSGGSNAYTFVSWSDGGAQQHTITVPTGAASYAATYSVTQNPLPPGLVAGYGFAEGSGMITAELGTTSPASTTLLARILSVYVNGLIDNDALSGTVPAAQSNFVGEREYWSENRQSRDVQLPGDDRRGARLQPGAQRGGDTAGHEYAQNRTLSGGSGCVVVKAVEAARG